MNATRRRPNLTSKRAQLALRFFTYGVMAIATIVLSVFAVFYAMGFRFNQNSLSVEQGGRVQLNSRPGDARVLVDGKDIGDNTPGRAYLTAGQHTVEMQRDGYHTWRRTFQLQPGQLLWLDYSRLVPSNVKTIKLHTFGSLADAMFSPDRRWLLLQETPNTPQYTLVDASNVEKPVITKLTIPDTQLTRISGALGTFKIIEWDFSSQAALVRHINGNISEVVRIERSRPEEAKNISRLFGLNIGAVHFAGGNTNVVYAQTDGVLRRLDINAGNASSALVSGLRRFTIYGDSSIAFVAERELTPGDATSRRALVGVYKDGKETLVRTYSPTTTLHIDITEYFRHQYLAISSGNKSVELLRDPADMATTTPVFVRFELDLPVEWVSFSNNGRMAVAGAGNSLVAHDLEVAHTYNTTLAGVQLSKPPKWLDDFYFWTDAGNSLQIVEFDGQNSRTISPVKAGYAASLSQNGKALFSFATEGRGVSLQAAILEE